MSVDAGVYRMRWLTMAVVIAGTMMSRAAMEEAVEIVSAVE